MVLFSKGKCLVMNEFGKKLISGVRTFNNCYGLVPNADIVCNSICLPNEDLVGKSGFVSHTKHIAEATSMDLFHSRLITCIM